MNTQATTIPVTGSGPGENYDVVVGRCMDGSTHVSASAADRTWFADVFPQRNTSTVPATRNPTFSSEKARFSSGTRVARLIAVRV
mgnify:CR=1 FL=1